MTDQLSTLIKRHRVRAEVLGSAHEPSGWDQPSYDYRIQLKVGRRRMELDFFTGIGWNREPTAADVLGCLVSDAAGVENTRNFDDWANEYGMDPDSRKAEAMYRKTVAQVEELRRLLGNLYDAFVWSENDI